MIKGLRPRTAVAAEFSATRRHGRSAKVDMPGRSFRQAPEWLRRRSSTHSFAVSGGDRGKELPYAAHLEAMTSPDRGLVLAPRLQEAEGGPDPASPPSAAAAAVSAAHAAAVEAGEQRVLVSLYASFEEMGVLSSSLDSDGEICTLVSDATGDVQMVCDSDPTRPISLAEEAVLRPLVPPTLLQDIEAKLEADLATLAVTILFAVGFIVLEFGVDGFIDYYYGESILVDVACVSVGLVVVFWLRLIKAPILRLDRWR